MVPRWKLKVVRDAIKACLPLQPMLRIMARYLRPYQDNQGNTRFAFEQGLEQLLDLRAARLPISGIVLEFGSGWMPIIPILFYLAGADEVILTDIERLMDQRTIERAKFFVRSNLACVAQTLGTDEGKLSKRLTTFAPSYLVPWEPSTMRPASVDIVISRAAFEHVPPPQLEEFLTQFYRIVRPGGAMCHIVDNSDHWQHHDHSLSRINFLRFDEHDLWWRIGCFNIQNYQNRLRHSDYIALFERTGWKIAEVSSGEPDAQCLKDLTTLPLAPAFLRYDQTDLAILTSHFVVLRP